MAHLKALATIALILSTAACAMNEPGGYGRPTTGAARSGDLSSKAPPLDGTRKIAEQDCSGPVELERGNLKCK